MSRALELLQNTPYLSNADYNGLEWSILELEREVDRLRHGWMMSECTSWFISGTNDEKFNAPKCHECKHTKTCADFCKQVIKKVHCST